MISGPMLCRRFIGRTAELGALMERYRAASQGQGSVVLVGGAAGIGKTRLITAFLTALGPEGERVAIGHCLEYAASPLGPFCDVLQQLVDLHPDVLDGARAIASALTSLISSSDGGARETMRALDEFDKRRQYGAFAQALQRFGEREVVTLIVEDAHWADLASLELLQFLAGRIASTRSLLIVTYRSDELHRTHPLAAALGKLTRGEAVWRIQLKTMTTSEIGSLIGATVEGRFAIGPGVVRRIDELADGNPLFAEELVKHVVESDARSAADVDLPLSLRDLVFERLSRFTDVEQALLSTAAVIGAEFNVALLGTVANRTADEVITTIRRARAQQLIIEQGAEPVQYAFRHALIREVLYRELLTDEARRLHERVAMELERLDETELRVDALAYHWWGARHAEKAAMYNELAGDRAVGVGAFADAATLYERALGDVGHEARSSRAAISTKLGEALFSAGDPKRAAHALELALSEYEVLGDVERSARLCARICVQYHLLSNSEQCRRWAVRAAEMIRSRPESAVKAEVIGAITGELAWLDDTELAATYLAELTRPDMLTMPVARMYYYSARGALRFHEGSVHEGLKDCRRAVEIADESGVPHAPIFTRSNLAWLATDAGLGDVALRACEDSVRVAHESGLAFREAAALAVHAQARLNSGELERARALVEEEMALAIDIETPLIQRLLLPVAIPLGLRLERPDLVRPFARVDFVERGLALGEFEVAGAAAAITELYVHEGRFADASALLHRSLPILTRVRGPGKGAPFGLVLIAGYGKRADIPIARAELEAWACNSASLVAQAYLALFDAFALRESEPRESVSSAARSAQLFADIGWPSRQAQALELAGTTAAALEIYRRTGDVAGTRRLEAALAVRNRRGRVKDALTPREREIAALVAAGKSNRAIAEALVLSERTVESHVAAILSKLHVASRSELHLVLANDMVAPSEGS
jgi:DNA-binding NarL/FixJ family response regulator